MPHAPSRKRKKALKRVLARPDLEHAKGAVLASLTSASGQRTYDHAIREFAWYCSEPRFAFNRTVVLRYRIHLEQQHYATSAAPGHGIAALKSGGGSRDDRAAGFAELTSATALLRLAGRAVPTLVLQMSWRHSIVSNRNRQDLPRHLADCDGDPRRVEPRGIEPLVVANGVVAPVIEEQIRIVGRRVIDRRSLHRH